MSKYEKLRQRIEQENVKTDITYDELKKYLKKNGYNLDRVKGSHHIFKNKEGKTINIPLHGDAIKFVYIKKVRDQISKEK